MYILPNFLSVKARIFLLKFTYFPSYINAHFFCIYPRIFSPLTFTFSCLYPPSSLYLFVYFLVLMYAFCYLYMRLFLSILVPSGSCLSVPTFPYISLHFLSTYISAPFPTFSRSYFRMNPRLYPCLYPHIDLSISAFSYIYPLISHMYTRVHNFYLGSTWASYPQRCERPTACLTRSGRVT